MLFETSRHFPLQHESWNPDLAFAAALEIMRETDQAFRHDTLWPAHPLDEEKSNAALNTMYYGIEGIAWALSHWSQTTGEKISVSSKEILEIALKRSAQEPPSYFFGEAGIRLALQRIQPSPESLEALLVAIEALRKSKTNEIMAGASGALIALQLLSELRSQSDLKSKKTEIANEVLALWKRNENDLPVWEQDYGRIVTYIGAAHGAVGNIYALLRAQEALDPSQTLLVRTQAIELLKKTAQTEDKFANWPAFLGSEDRIPLVHWCHGAPGVVMQLATLIPRNLDFEFDELMIKAGNLIWAAGALHKGPSLCHGTAGSGAALLKLYERTHDIVWLERARGFAMQTIRQIQDAKKKYGQLRYSLWTGDVGAALFLDSCVREKFETPMLDFI